MRSKMKRAISMCLALALTLALLPASLVAAALEAGYDVLVEPDSSIRGVQEDTYENTAVVWATVYFDPSTGKQVEWKKGSEIENHPYYLAKYTGSGIEKVSDWYVYMSGLSESGYALMQDKDYRCGIIKYDGTVILEPTYDDIDWCADGRYAIAWKDGTQVLLDLEKKTEISLEGITDSIVGYSNGLLRVHNSFSDYRYVTIDGDQAFDQTFLNYAGDFYNGYAVVKDSGPGMIIDTLGNIILTTEDKDYELMQDDSVHVEEDGTLMVRNSDYDYGRIDMTGEVVQEFGDYGSAANHMFINGFATNVDGAAMVDKQGTVVIPGGSYWEVSHASSTNLVWATKSSIGGVSVLKVHSATDNSTPAPSTPSTDNVGSTEEHIYDAPDPGVDVTLPVEQLETVTDPASAADAVDTLSDMMTEEQKSAPTGIDLATLYAETAVAKAASKAVSGNDILINAAAVADLAAVAAETAQAVETALVNGGITTARYLANTVTLTTDELGEITIRIDPDILTTDVDKIRVETPVYALTFKTADLEQDLTGILTFSSQTVNGGAVDTLAYPDAPVTAFASSRVAVMVTVPGDAMSNPITVSLPSDGGDTTYKAVVTSKGKATASKYNPATMTMDGKVNSSGTYSVADNEKDFTDIGDKSAEMQKAIRYLASKGIINGTTSTTFSPDNSISRAEIAKLIVEALGKLDNSVSVTFKDVTKSNWYYAAAGCSQKQGYIKGFEDNTFRGGTTISKEQIVVVSSRVLTAEMNYKTPDNTSTYLSKYSDTVANWAKGGVALATKENLVVYRTDGTFSGAKNMTRGDAAIIIYRLFQKIW